MALHQRCFLDESRSGATQKDSDAAITAFRGGREADSDAVITALGVGGKWGVLSGVPSGPGGGLIPDRLSAWPVLQLEGRGEDSQTACLLRVPQSWRVGT